MPGYRQLVGDHVVGARLYLDRVVARAGAGQGSAQDGNTLLVLGQLFVLGVQIPIEYPAISPDFKQLFLQVGHHPFQVGGRGLDNLWLHRFGDHQQQDDCPEATADHIEKRHRRFSECPGLAPGHQGQSFEGLIKEPLLTCASCQNSEAAMGSPSMGARMMFTGTFCGS